MKFENWSNKHVLEADLLNYLRTGYDINLFNSYGPKTKFEMAVDFAVPNLVQNVDRFPNYGPKTKFKMTAAAILNLLPVAIFDIQLTFHC